MRRQSLPLEGKALGLDCYAQTVVADDYIGQNVA